MDGMSKEWIFGSFDMIIMDWKVWNMIKYTCGMLCLKFRLIDAMKYDYIYMIYDLSNIYVMVRVFVTSLSRYIPLPEICIQRYMLT